MIPIFFKFPDLEKGILVIFCSIFFKRSHSCKHECLYFVFLINLFFDRNIFNKYKTHIYKCIQKFVNKLYLIQEHKKIFHYFFRNR